MVKRSTKINKIDIDRLYNFLGGLQASGYQLDARHYVVLSDLFMMLIARGESLNELDLKKLIAPVICSTPAEQNDFYLQYDSWYRTLSPVNQTISSNGSIPTSDLNAKEKPNLASSSIRTVLIWIISILGVLTAIITLAKSGITILTTALGQFSNNFLFYGAITVLLSLLGWIGWQSWYRYKENQYITREAARENPVYTKVSVANQVQEVMPVMHFKSIVSAMRRRTQMPSNEIDVDRTIETALSSNNLLKVVYRQRQVMPEYVVLIERKSRLDQQSRFVQEMTHRLATEGVWLHQYEYIGDPRLCFPLHRKGAPLNLRDLQTRHPDARLLVFSGVKELINPLTGHVQDWLEQLSRWRERVILTPDKIHKSLNEELQVLGFSALPMNLTGLASLVSVFNSDGRPYSLMNGESILPENLVERPLRWTGREAPPADEVNQLVNGVKQYLGESGFYWLCASAVYPELRWELTLYLGGALRDRNESPLLDPDILQELAHLPWFRFGYMPDWMRLNLIQRLTQEQETSVRLALGQMLSKAFESDGFDLAFSRGEHESIQKRTQRFLNALIRRSSSIRQFDDHIFLKFVASGKLRKLAVQIPRSWSVLRDIGFGELFKAFRTGFSFNAGTIQTSNENTGKLIPPPIKATANNGATKTIDEYKFDENKVFANKRLIPTFYGDAYSDKVAWLMASMSSLAYIEFEDRQEELARLQLDLKSGGFELVSTCSKGSTQAFLAKNNDVFVLAFRGTESKNIQDINADIRAYKSLTTGRMARMEFSAILEEIEEEIVKLFQEYRWPLYVTGHGIGGAFAIRATLQLDHKIGDHQIVCYTFGSPRIGINLIETKIKSPVYRIINSVDIVTLVPSIGYIHIGEERYLSNSSPGSNNFRFYRGIPIFRRFYEMLLASILPFKWPDFILCNSIHEYRRKLEVYANKQNQSVNDKLVENETK